MQEYFNDILKDAKISFENYAEYDIKDEKDVSTLLSSISHLEDGAIGRYSVKIPKLGGKFIFEIPLPFYDIFRGLKFKNDVEKVIVFTDHKNLEELYPVDEKVSCNYFYIPVYPLASPKMYMEIFTNENIEELEVTVYAGFTRRRKELYSSGKVEKFSKFFLC